MAGKLLSSNDKRTSMNRRSFLLTSAATVFSIAQFRVSIADNRTFQLAYFHNYPPLSWGGSDGMQGILIDLLTEVLEKRMGIRTRHTGYPWSRAQQQVRNGLADAFCTVPTPERREYTRISKEPTLLSTFTIFIHRHAGNRAALKKINSLDDLGKFRIGHYLGSGWAKKNLKGRGFKLIETSTLDSALAMLAIGRVDIVIDSSQAIRYRIRQLNLQNTLEELPPVLDQAPFALCIGKKSPFVNILPSFEENMRAVRDDGTQQIIMARYS